MKTMLTRHARTAFAALIGAGLIASAAVPAQAQEQAYYSEVGGWTIYAEANNLGALTRCYADLRSSSGLLRFAWFANSRQYWISWPSPTGGQFGPAAATLSFDRGYRTTATSNRSNRPAIMLDPQMVDNLMRANENLRVDQGGRTGLWPLYGTRMEDVFVAVENCVNENSQ